MFRKGAVFLVALLLCGAILSSLVFAQEGAVLRFGLSSDPPALSSLVSGGTASRTVKLTVYEGLVGYTPEGDTELQLAESVDVENPTTYEPV